MQIFLMRHGQAGMAPPGSSDSERSLTPEGEQQVERVVSRGSALLGYPRIVASPYRRAQQTASIVQRTLGRNLELQTSSALTPESSPRDAWAEVRCHRDVTGLLLVGHEPLFSALTAFMLGFPQLEIEFGTATLVGLEVVQIAAQPRGTLLWMLPARLI